MTGGARRQPAVELASLTKVYGQTVAVDNLSLLVAEGEIFGILGPNGAGKTTAVECVMGLRRPDSGSVRVMGVNPAADRDALHLLVGAQLQSSALQAKLRVGEIVRGPGRPPRLGPFADLLSTEGRLAWRNPRGIVIGLGFPTMLLVLFGELPHFSQHLGSGHSLTRFDAEVPTLATMVVAALALLTLPSPLAVYRDQGILRRMSITPVPPRWVLAAQVVVNLALAAVGEVMLFVVGYAALFGLCAWRFFRWE
jgi:energy-coupling factor transporter ATP-binding protein EcfA2